MNLKNIKYLSILLIFVPPISAFSTPEIKNMIAVKKTAVKKAQKSPLIGNWKSSDGLFTIKFLSENQLEFNGESETYTLIQGAIRINDEEGNIDYKYSITANTLLINFPEGYQIQFQREITSRDNKTTQSKNKGNCNDVYLPDDTKGGCQIRLVTPSNCETIDLSNGRSYEFAWQTGGTFCEAPYQFYIAGNPVTEENTILWKFSSYTGRISRTNGGFVTFKASDLAGLTSNNGLYHWVVMSFHGSHPASQTFRVKK